jgi:hypothetical protein
MLSQRTSSPFEPIEPMLEAERFFAGPRDRQRSPVDAQSEALRRLVSRCEHVRPHLHSADALGRFIDGRSDPARVRRRVSLALAFEQPGLDLVYGRVGTRELELFRHLALRRLPAVLWVFS